MSTVSVVHTPVEVRAEVGDVDLTATVGLALEPDVDPIAERAARELLAAAGVGDIVPGALPNTTVTVWVRIGPRDGWRPGPPDAPEGYRVVVGRDSAGCGHILLHGSDARGAVYAARHLRGLLSGRTLPGLELRTAPAVRYRGVVEGFYGTPWSHSERLVMLDFLGAHRMNTYLYAPKADPYHRERWREPYPEEQLSELGELIDRATSNGVDLVFGLSPGLSICYSSPADTRTLLEKFGSAYRVGARSFAVLLDDIDYESWNCATDRISYGLGAGAAGRAHADLVNRVRDWVAAKPDTGRLQLVPSEYYNAASSPYKRMLAEYLHPDVLVHWVGVGIVPDRTTLDQVARAAEVYGHDVCVWENYPVNDYLPGRILLAPYTGRERGLAASATGIVANPMNHSALSRLTLRAFGEYGWDDRGWTPESAWERAVADLAGGDPAVVEAIRWFADLNWYDGTTNGARAPRLAAAVTEFWHRWPVDPVEALAGITGAIEQLRVAPGVLAAGVTDPEFVEQAGPWLEAADCWAEAIAAAVECLAAVRAGDGSAAWERRRVVCAAVERAEAIRDRRAPHDSGPPRIADGVADTFVTDLIREHDRALGAAPARIVVTSPVRIGPQVTVDLGRPHGIGAVGVELDPGDGAEAYRRLGVLECSLDGSDWVELTAGGPPSIALTPPPDTRGRYVRYRAIAEDAPDWLVVRQVSVQTYDLARPTVGGGPPAIRGSAMAKVVDGDLESWYIASRPPRSGEALIVRWPRPKALVGLTILQADAAASARIDIATPAMPLPATTDEPEGAAGSNGSGGEHWARIGELTGAYTSVEFASRLARAVRLVWEEGQIAPRLAAVIPRFAE